MTIKELKCLHSAIWHVKELIEELDCEDYPFTEFQDPDLCKMFYELNDMSIAITKKIDEAEAATK